MHYKTVYMLGVSFIASTVDKRKNVKLDSILNFIKQFSSNKMCSVYKYDRMATYCNILHYNFIVDVLF